MFGSFKTKETKNNRDIIEATKMIMNKSCKGLSLFYIYSIIVSFINTCDCHQIVKALFRQYIQIHMR